MLEKNFSEFETIPCSCCSDLWPAPWKSPHWSLFWSDAITTREVSREKGKSHSGVSRIRNHSRKRSGGNPLAHPLDRLLSEEELPPWLIPNEESVRWLLREPGQLLSNQEMSSLGLGASIGGLSNELNPDGTLSKDTVNPSQSHDAALALALSNDYGMRPRRSRRATSQSSLSAIAALDSSGLSDWDWVFYD